MTQNKSLRAALLALAALFLAVAWTWDGFIAIGRAAVRLIPWARFKQAFVALIDWLPTPIVLLIFLVPLAIVEPLLTLAVVAMALGYVISGAIAYVLLKVFGFGLIAVIFDLTKHKLLTVAWFARAYEKVVAFHHYADSLVAPYKRASAELYRQWRSNAAAAMGRTPGIARIAARVAARRRAANGRPPAGAEVMPVRSRRAP
jgi:hypothetical protein